MKNLLYIATIIGLFSCESSDTMDNNYYNLDTAVKITVVDINGNDLLNPNNANCFLEENIIIYYLIDGEEEEIYDPNMDCPRNFCIYAPDTADGKYWIGLTPNIVSDSTVGYGITYIKWNDNDKDTIKCAHRSGEGYTIVTKVWFNDELVWNEDDELTNRHIVIVK